MCYTLVLVALRTVFSCPHSDLANKWIIIISIAQLKIQGLENLCDFPLLYRG